MVLHLIRISPTVNELSSAQGHQLDRFTAAVQYARGWPLPMTGAACFLSWPLASGEDDTAHRVIYEGYPVITVGVLLPKAKFVGEKKNLSVKVLCAGEFFFNGDGCKAPDKLLSLLSEKVKLQKGPQKKENYNIAL
jgi:hypothetical protein